jgi:excisionase family DNA binding protein
MKETTFIAIAFGSRTALLTEAELRAGLVRAADMGLVKPTQNVTSTVPSERWLNSRELAQLTGIGDTTLEQWAREERIPSIRAGKALRFKASAVEAALAAQK